MPCFACRPDGRIDPVQAAEVRQASSSFVAGAGIKTIADDWNRRGIVNTRGAARTPKVVRLILRNRRYIAGRWLTRRDSAKNRTETYVGQGQVGSYRRQRHLPGGGDETGRPGAAQQQERIGAQALRLRPVPLRGMRPGAGLAEPTDVRHHQRARNTKRSASSTNAAPRRTSSEKLGTLRGVVTAG